MDALGSFEPGFPTHLQGLGDEVDGCTSEEDGREDGMRIMGYPRGERTWCHIVVTISGTLMTW